MLLGVSLLAQTHCLQSCPNQLEGVGYDGGEHARGDASGDFVYLQLLHLTVKHVVQTGEETLLDAGGQQSAEKPTSALLSVYVTYRTMYAGVTVKVGQLESRLYDTEGIGDYATDYSGDKRMHEVVTRMLIFSFQIFKSTEE